MIESLKETIIKEASENVSSEEILSAIKIAGLNPYVMGGAGILLGGLGMNAINKSSTQKALEEAEQRALLSGLAGAGGGYIIGKGSLDTPAFVGGDDNLEFSPDDMKYVFGR
tara:strand:- start:3017 stop:3352 length:336 start_codon:yes stop_codon:yes gene_type:complete